MSCSKNISSLLRQTASVMRIELREIVTDGGVLLIMVFAMFIYATLYGLVYGSEVLREVPIAVVDESRTSASRSLITSIGEGPDARIAFEAQDMQQAQRLMRERRAYGVVYIPADYERRLLGGGQATVAVYCDASYFLIYRQIFESVATSLTATGAMVEFRRLVAQGLAMPQAMAVTEPIIYESHSLFNPSLGYGIFVMPAVIVIIIQQTLLMGIGIIGGTWREHNLFAEVLPDGRQPSTFALMAGKTLSYFMVSAVTTAVALTIPYYLFGYPMRGSITAVAALIVPYILACTMLGIALSTLFRHREEPIMWILWSSIPILMLSGVSYPKEAMPQALVALGSLFPSSHAVGAFIRVRDMGATAVEVMPEIVALWIQVVFYGGVALLLIWRANNKKWTLL